MILCVESGVFKGTLSGITVGTVTQSEKIWRSFQALGDIAFAYSFAIVLIEVQVKFRPFFVLILFLYIIISHFLIYFFDTN